MNSIPQFPTLMADVQNARDHRSIGIDEVGIRAIRHPLLFRDRDGTAQPTVATFEMYVSLPPEQKGTHMSRFVAILNERVHELSIAGFGALLRHTADRLESSDAFIRVRMPFFVNKHAPVSGVASLLDYDLMLDGRIENGKLSVMVEVVVPVTSLCPCSKEISEYGAHNQRSHVTVRAWLADTSLCVRDLIDRVESEASSELFGLLKRPDEKLVTEQAYDNPKFVEDMVRDVARNLCEETRIERFEVSSENFESIHNHSAYALVRGRPGGGAAD